MTVWGPVRRANLNVMSHRGSRVEVGGRSNSISTWHLSKPTLAQGREELTPAEQCQFTLICFVCAGEEGCNGRILSSKSEVDVHLQNHARYNVHAVRRLLLSLSCLSICIGLGVHAEGAAVVAQALRGNSVVTTLDLSGVVCAVVYPDPLPVLRLFAKWGAMKLGPVGPADF